jgi:septal ring-binding cell division protein DamX
MVMASSQDTEITLGTAKLLGLFFGLVAICAVFFALGYTLGRKSDSGLAVATLAAPSRSNGAKPTGSGATSSPMTFYKAVEQQNANPQLTPAKASTGEPAADPATPAEGSTPAGSSANPPDPMAAVPTNGYFVQVAAVSKKDDASALVDALKKKEYAAFVAAAADNLFRVQVGPFADVKEAEATRARLINDGYSPILKK